MADGLLGDIWERRPWKDQINKPVDYTPLMFALGLLHPRMGGGGGAVSGLPAGALHGAGPRGTAIQSNAVGMPGSHMMRDAAMMSKGAANSNSPLMMPGEFGPIREGMPAPFRPETSFRGGGSYGVDPSRVPANQNGNFSLPGRLGAREQMRAYESYVDSLPMNEDPVLYQTFLRMQKGGPSPGGLFD